MKRLFTVLSLIACMAVFFVSCKPEPVKLHQRVGEVYKDPNLYKGDLQGDGIIFYVDGNGDSALICTFTDLKMMVNATAGTYVYNECTWNTFGADTTLEKDTIQAQIKRLVKGDTVMVYPVQRKKTPWYIKEGSCVEDSVGYDTVANKPIYVTVCDTIYNRVGKNDVVLWAEIDSNYYYGLINANSSDGRINTDIIIKASIPKNSTVIDSTKSAAMYCRQYYKKQKYAVGDKVDNSDSVYIKTKGMWFLPSLDELRHLSDARGKINEANANTPGFEILNSCYWSSNERDHANAWYKCITENAPESYIPKNNATTALRVRAVRKVKL